VTLMIGTASISGMLVMIYNRHAVLSHKVQVFINTAVFVVIVIMIIIIRHEEGFDRPALASSNSLHRSSNLSLSIRFIIQYYSWHPVVHSC